MAWSDAARRAATEARRRHKGKLSELEKTQRAHRAFLNRGDPGEHFGGLSGAYYDIHGSRMRSRAMKIRALKLKLKR